MRRSCVLLALVLLGLIFAGCAQPEPEFIEKVVTQIVTDRIVETVIIEQTPQSVEREVTRVVEVEKVVTPTPPPAGPKILRIGGLADGYRYDPNKPTDVTVGAGNNNVNIFDTLTHFDENFGLQPWLATSWEYDSERGVWTFFLRDDIYFHDGVKLTAQIIADYFNYFSQDSYMAQLLQIGEGATTAADDLTLEIESANLTLPAVASHMTMGIRRGDPFKGEHIGTGPFIFVEYVPQDHITVRKNPDYWAGEPSVDGIEFRFLPDPITRLLALQAGEVDVIYDPPRDAMAALEGRDDITIYSTVPGTWLQLDLVSNGPEPYTILQDIALREALGLAINRQELVDTAWGGFAETGQSFVAAGLLGDYVDLIEGYEYDPERAMELLEQAGWIDNDEDGIREKDGRRLTLRLVNGWPSAAENEPVPQVLQAQWKQVGIDLEIVSVSDFPSLMTYLVSKEADIILETWTNTSPTPCMMVRFGFYLPEKPNMWQSFLSPAHVGFSEIVEQIDNCTSSIEHEDAQRWAAEAIHTAIDKARVSITALAQYRVWAAGPRVKSLVPHPITGYMRWELVDLAD